MSADHPTQSPALLGGRYRLDELIGSGGMGRVHRAWDTRLGRRVAIKVLSPELAADPAVSARLRAEGQVLAALQHPNLVTLHDVPDDAEATYLVMELVEGESLAARLRREGPLPIREVAAIVTGVAAGLSALHGAGIAHGDVSPANVLLGLDGRARLADLGLARDLAASIPPSDGLIHGTLRYLAPERLDDAPASPAADVYALAAVTYAALLGRPPAVATDVVKLRAALAEPPIRPSLLRTGLSPALDETLLAALGPAEGRPTAYHLAVALAHALRTSADPLPSAGATTTVVAAAPVGISHRTVRGRTAPGRVRRMALALATGAMVLAVGGVSLAALDQVLARPGMLPELTLTAAADPVAEAADPAPIATAAPIAAPAAAALAATIPVVAGRPEVVAPSGTAPTGTTTATAAALHPATLAGGLAQAMSGIRGTAATPGTAVTPGTEIAAGTRPTGTFPASDPGPGPVITATRPVTTVVVRLPATVASEPSAPVIATTGDVELALGTTPQTRAAVTTRAAAGVRPAISREASTVTVTPRTAGTVVRHEAEHADRSGRGKGSDDATDDRSGSPDASGTSAGREPRDSKDAGHRAAREDREDREDPKDREDPEDGHSGKG